MARTHFLAATLLATAFTGTAWAQTAPSSSNITLFGVIDLTLNYGKGSLSTAKGLNKDGLAGSRFGVRGNEDLGGGLRASFVIEHGFSPDTGSATPVFWNRQVLVALGSARLGEIQFGRIYTPTFLVHATYDAFGPQGTAAQQVLLGSAEFTQPTIAGSAIRANNAINYTTPAGLGGFSAQAMVALAEGAATGRYNGVRGSWSSGPFAVDLALARYGSPAIGDLKALTLGARYKLGDLSFYGLHDRANSGNSFDTRGTQFSLVWLVGGLTELKASVAQSSRDSATGAAAGTTRRYGIGAVHHLSKRTAVYTSLARASNSDGASTALNGATTAANKSSTGMDLGLRHSF